MAHQFPALGIDSGAHEFHAAIMGANGLEHVPLEGKTGQRNAVFFDGESFLVGDQAVNAKAHDPARYAEQLKLYLGRRDPEGKPVTVIEGIGEKGRAPGLFGALYSYIRSKAERHLARSAEGCVLSHPDEASQLVKDDLKAAAHEAGLRKVFFIGESQALLLYAHHIKPIAPGTTGLIVDNGHLTNNVIVFEVKDNLTLKVLGVATSEKCGGGEYTATLEDFIRAELGKSGQEVDDANPNQVMALYQEAERVKHLLSEHDKATIMLALGKEPFSALLTRGEAEKLWAPLRKECIRTVSRALKEAGLKKNGVEALVLSGGNVNIPSLHRDICAFVRHEAARLPNPELAVAHGATLAAPELYGIEGHSATGGTRERRRVLRVTTQIKRTTSRNLALRLFDLEAQADCMEILVPKGQPIPIKKSNTYSLTRDTLDEAARSVEITILQPESAGQDLDEAPVLKSFDADDLVASAKAKDRIRIEIEVSADEQTAVEVIDTEARDGTKRWRVELDQPGGGS